MRSHILRRSFISIVGFFATTIAVMTQPLLAASEPVVLREKLGQTWTRQLVSIPFTAAKGVCALDGVALRGPAGPIPVQLSNVVAWPDNSASVQSARLWFVVDLLKPLESISYELSMSPAKVAAIASDLQVVEKTDRITLSTNAVTIELVGGDYPTASGLPLKETFGPVRSVKMGTDQGFGGSRLTGDAKLARRQTKIVDSGPVFAKVVTTYTLTDGNVLQFTTSLIAGDNAVRWDLHVRDDRPDLGMELMIPVTTGLKQATSLKGYGQWSRADRVIGLNTKAEPFAYLAPNSSVVAVFPDSPWSVRLGEMDKSVVLASRNTAEWVDPVAPLTYGGFKEWNLDMIPKSWEPWKRKRIALIYSDEGSLKLQAPMTKGGRSWLVSYGSNTAISDSLDKVMGMILDWPGDQNRKHPCLFVDMNDINAMIARAASEPEFQRVVSSAGQQYAAGLLRFLVTPKEKRTAQEQQQLVSTLGNALAKLGEYDVMRHAIGTISLYDALIDSDLITSEQRSLFRAQAAYLGYLLADPKCWSMERGLHSGNPNMSVSYTLSLGIIACALSDHPMAKRWAATATAWMDKWLTDDVGPNGEWLTEGSRYGHVSLEPLVTYAIAAKRAGFADFTNDVRLKRLLLYFAKTYTSPDSQRQGYRVSGAFGRGTSGDVTSLFGVAARMTAQVDPAFSGVMQWAWATGGYSTFMGDHRLGGYDLAYMDSRMPAAAPDWSSELFPKLGAVLRSGFNTPNESYINLLAAVDAKQNLDIWTPEIGSIAQWFGRGQPLSTCSTLDYGYKSKHELLRNGVLLARNWGRPEDSKSPYGFYVKTDFEAFSPQSGADYVRSTFTHTSVDDRDWFPGVQPPMYPVVTPAKEARLVWTRQVLFVKDKQALGPAYLILRDSTRGGQPTAWQFWTLSEKIGTPEQARDIEMFLADKPGTSMAPSRELPISHRYTALGQMNVDVEYFIAEPQATPRHTLRYGGTDHSKVPQWQDLMHLQLPNDGSYYVAVYPRPRNEAAPTFTTLADGKVIRTTSSVGSDYAFLADTKAAAESDRFGFEGTAGVIQERGDAVMLSLSAAGLVRWDKYIISSQLPASLTIVANELSVTRSASQADQPVSISAPGAWVAAGDAKGITNNAGANGTRMTLPPGMANAIFRKQ
jgi:hypothetical protein